MDKKLSQSAIEECLRELRAACRMPIDDAAIDAADRLMRPQFEKLLDNAKGAQQWAVDGPLMRDNGRFVGTFAEFFANRQSKSSVGAGELMAAIQIVRAQCHAGEQHGKFSPFFAYCVGIPVDNAVVEFLQVVSPLQ